MFGRMLKSSIAKDNGRSNEFSTKKRTYETSRCFECGEEGHLSYQCPKNALGIREPQKPNKSGRKSHDRKLEDDDSLGAAIRHEQQKRSLEEGSSSILQKKVITNRKRFKPSSYFSDEEEVSE